VIQFPDVNVLVALVWEAHMHHSLARRWFASLEGDEWGSCPVTQAGFVRVSANPMVTADAVTVRQATAVLAELTRRGDHRFLADEVAYVDNPLVPHEALVGFRQVTDAHLIGLARHHDATLITLDSGMSNLGGDSVRLLR